MGIGYGVKYPKQAAPRMLCQGRAKRYCTSYRPMNTELALPDDLKADISLATRILPDEGCKEIYILGQSRKAPLQVIRI
jgi:hypothetical protein